MFSLLITALLVSLVQSNTSTNRININLREIAKGVNSNPKSTWKADNYGIDELSFEEWSDKLGTKLRRRENSPKSDTAEDLFSKQNRHRFGSKSKFGASTYLPVSYDARNVYPQCTSIGHIRDQSACGSCWAVSAASVLSDRLCIFSNGTYNFELSSRFLLSCDWQNYGCDGGYLDRAWEFLQDYGTVTGGEYQTDEGCQDYPLYPCGYPRKTPCPSSRGFLTPKCLNKKCDNEFYKYKKEERVFLVDRAYHVGNSFFNFFNEYEMRRDIYENGPLQVGFDVYADFFTYKSGIYEHDYSKLSPVLGGHAVKLIGWGEEDGVEYWLAANSWGTEWGENGFFRIIRGENNCHIEDEAYAGIPII